MLKKNVGAIDAKVRIILGVILLLAIVLPKGIVGLIGLGVIFTGLTGYCGLYTIFGKSTCELEEKSNYPDKQ